MALPSFAAGPVIVPAGEARVSGRGEGPAELKILSHYAPEERDNPAYFLLSGGGGAGSIPDTGASGIVRNHAFQKEFDLLNGHH